MKILYNFDGENIFLKEERIRHILEHPEMAQMIPAVTETVSDPEIVLKSSSDVDVHLYYRFYADTIVGGKYLCVIIKTKAPHMPFVLTAYLTDAIKKGEVVWLRKS